MLYNNNDIWGLKMWVEIASVVPVRGLRIINKGVAAVFGANLLSVCRQVRAHLGRHMSPVVSRPQRDSNPEPPTLAR